MAIQYCKKCVLPETKPDLQFDDDGVCSACLAYSRREETDWDLRWQELKQIFERYRSHDRSNYDCVIPVSGGKDSTFQVLKVLELGANPLCVYARTCHLTEIGRRNLESLRAIGVDVIEFQTNPVVRQRINRIGLTQVGDIGWPEHLTIFTVPVRVATQYNVPLIIWGENPQNEYGGPAASQESNILNRRWLEEFGGLLGMRVTDLLEESGIERHHLIPYTYPTDEELNCVGVTGLFLGHFVPWDGLANMLIALGHGMEVYPSAIENAFVNYENLDNAYMGVHDYFKFLKYGYGRASDNASMQIRRGRISRDMGLEFAQRFDGQYPVKYLGVELQTILEEINVNKTEFDRICDRFTNKKLFRIDNAGNLIRDQSENLIKLNYDNQ